MYSKEQEVNEKTRSYTLDTLVKTFTPLLQRSTAFSEVQFRDLWISQLQKNKNIFSEGWYQPPPYGIGMLIGDTTKKSRTNYPSLRSKKCWPNNKSLFNKTHDFIYLYASPVEKKTGIIGDCGGTFYTGNNAAVHKHLKHCLTINQKIADSVKVGMTYAEIYIASMTIMKENRLSNEVVSSSDKTGVNIGHSIPESFHLWTKKEQNKVKEGKWKDILELISKKRKYINAIEKETVKPGTMITIEPRLTVLNKPNIPMASFHTTLHIGKNGEKRLLTNFDTLFRLFGMGYML